MSRDVRQLAEGFYFGECPRWRGDRLWFSDFFGHAVLSVSMEGDLRTELRLGDQPAGLGWTPDGDLLVVAMLRRQVLRLTGGGALIVHADLGALASHHCNDMVVDARGAAYVGEFGFDLESAIADRGVPDVLASHPTANLLFVSPQGEARIAAAGMHFPNGSVLTPDGATLIVAETLSGEITAFPREAGGALGPRRTWAVVRPRVPDGLALDAQGAVWFANAAAPECVRVEPGGRVSEVIETGAPCFACALGGDDGRTLFMLTAPGSGRRRAAGSPRGRLLTARVEAPLAPAPT